ncbi:polysaccharide deacetylase family protein [Bradyrhizobium sp. HKCCYLS2058]|uniref:polysaccharide deacetylase family protein n=1 Tax=Bradyrhizobium TaxID=374 RepID=UPI003EBDFF5D
MRRFRKTFIRAGLEALYLSGAHVWLRPIFSGVGAIYTLHHVRPHRDADFQPNCHLEVTPDFLREMLSHLRDHDIEIITLDELHSRLVAKDFSRRFACFTFDDGYRDNRDFALPVMREFDAPFTIYVTTDFASGNGRLWWVTLERLVAKTNAIDIKIGGLSLQLDASTPAAKCVTFQRLHDWLRALPGEHDVRREISALCARYDVDEASICRELCLSWDELRALSVEPLISIGAHSISHCNLAKQTEETARIEIADSRARIENELQRPVLHMAYPYGDRAAASQREFVLAAASGYKTAVTTRPGMIFAESADHLTALSRVSLNGHYQDARVLPVLTSGAATAMWNGFRRIDAA